MTINSRELKGKTKYNNSSEFYTYFKETTSEQFEYNLEKIKIKKKLFVSVCLPANAGWTGLDPFRFFTGTVGTLKHKKTNFLSIYSFLTL